MSNFRCLWIVFFFFSFNPKHVLIVMGEGLKKMRSCCVESVIPFCGGVGLKRSVVCVNGYVFNVNILCLV